MLSVAIFHGGVMRKFGLLLLLLLVACGEKPAAMDPQGPEVGVSSAPGIAVSYRYGFRLPVERVAAAQEDNAAQCEALGVAQCRVSGMTYQVGRDRQVVASLELRLAPDIARHFGRQAIEAIGKHGGMLVNARIDSEEAGAAQAGANADSASRNTERARIEAQLARPGLGSAERTTLQDQLTALAEADRASAGIAREATIKLARTPMTLDYESGDVDLSLSDGPIVGAMKDGWSNIVSGFAVILLIVITLLPWIAFAVLVVWVSLRVKRWLNRRQTVLAEPDSPED